MTQTAVSTTPRWLTTDEQAGWRHYLRGTRLLNEALDAALVEHGLRLTEYEILSMLSEAPGGRLRMSVLAGLVVQSRSRLTHTATRLERLGWVERRSCLDDRRGVELTLTGTGRQVLEEVAKAHVASVRENFLDLLTPEQFATVGEAMGRVV
jgi:DNA-binding MarR family transcriptional regulator